MTKILICESVNFSLCATGSKEAIQPFAVDEARIEDEACFDDQWVLLTNRDLSAAETALK